MARQIETFFDTNEYSATSSVGVEVASKSFVPKANTKYLVLVSYNYRHSSTGIEAKTSVRQTSSSGTLLGYTADVNFSTSERYIGGTICGLSYGASPPGTDYIKVFAWDQYGTATTYVSNIRIVIMELDSSTEMTGSTSCNSNTNTSYTDILTLTFTPATQGDYLVMGYFASGVTTTGNYSYGVIDIDGTDYQESYCDHGANGRHPHFFIQKVTLTAAQHTVKLQHKVSGGSGTYCYPKLIAFRLDDFYANEVTETTGQTSTTDTTYTTDISKTATNTSHPSLIIAKTNGGEGSTTSYFGQWRFTDGTNVFNESIIRGAGASVTNYPSNFSIVYDADPSETWYSQRKTSNAAASFYYKERSIHVLDLYEDTTVAMAGTVTANSSTTSDLTVYSYMEASITASSSATARMEPQLRGKLGAVDRVFNGDFEFIGDDFKFVGWTYESAYWDTVYADSTHLFIAYTNDEEAATNPLEQTVDLTGVEELTFEWKGTGYFEGMPEYTTNVRVYIDSTKIFEGYPDNWNNHWDSVTISLLQYGYSGTHTLKFYVDINETYSHAMGFDNVRLRVPNTNAVAGTLDLQPMVAGSLAGQSTTGATLNPQSGLKSTVNTSATVSSPMFDLQPGLSTSEISPTRGTSVVEGNLTSGISLAASVTAQSSVTGNAGTEWSFVSSVSGQSITSGTFYLTVGLAGTVDALSVVSTSLDRQPPHAGAVAALSSASVLTLDTQSGLAGTVASTSHAEADMSIYRVPVDFEGSIEAVSSVSTVEMNFVTMREIWRSVNGGTFELLVFIPFDDFTYEDHDVSGGNNYCYKARKVLDRTAHDWSNTDCSVFQQTAVPIEASIEATSTTVAVTLDLQSGLVSLVEAVSTISNASLDLQSGLVSQVSAVSSTAGQIDAQQPFVSAVSASSLVGGAMIIDIALATYVGGASYSQGALGLDFEISSTVESISVVEGLVGFDFEFSSSVEGVSSVAGDLSVDRGMVSSVAVISSVTGTAILRDDIQGSVSAQSSMTGQFFTLFLDADWSIPNEYARITWWEAV